MKINDLFSFSFINGVGEKTLKKLRKIDKLDDLYSMDDNELLQYLPDKNTVNEFRTKFDEYREKAYTCRKKLAADGALILSMENSMYPEKLLEADSFPVFLYCIGNINLITHSPAAAISGPRKASRDGLKASFELAQKLVNNDTSVISGLAIGVDTYAHRGSYKSGKAIAVLPQYFPVYPYTNRVLCNNILQNDGLIIAEYYTTQNIKFQLLNRDKIIVNLADKLYIPDSFASDSGTAYTIKYAISRGKPLYAKQNDKFTRLYEEP